jgi:hypothetical protein
MVGMWEPNSQCFLVKDQLLDIDIDDIYFLTGLSCRGESVEFGGQGGGGESVDLYVSDLCVEGTCKQGRKLPTQHVSDIPLRTILYTDTIVGMVLVQTSDVHMENVINYLSHGLVSAELKYSYIEKLALAAAFVVHKFRHYIILQTTIVISDANPMRYILSHQILGGQYSKWVVILSEFDLIFSTPKAKKFLVFAKLMAGLPRVSQPLQELESLPDDSLFLMDSSDPWYRDILVYLQTQRFWPSSTKDDRRWLRHLTQHYLIIGDALYHRGVDTMLHRCVTHEEVELIMNDCHLGACGGHLSRLATTQKILHVRYFW